MDLKAIIKEIDAQFGAGYAKANPSLVGQALLAKALTGIDETLAQAVEATGQIKLKLF